MNIRKIPMNIRKRRFSSATSYVWLPEGTNIGLDHESWSSKHVPICDLQVVENYGLTARENVPWAAELVVWDKRDTRLPSSSSSSSSSSSPPPSPSPSLSLSLLCLAVSYNSVFGTQQGNALGSFLARAFPWFCRSPENTTQIYTNILSNSHPFLSEFPSDSHPVLRVPIQFSSSSMNSHHGSPCPCWVSRVPGVLALHHAFSRPRGVCATCWFGVEGSTGPSIFFGGGYTNKTGTINGWMSEIEHDWTRKNPPKWGFDPAEQFFWGLSLLIGRYSYPTLDIAIIDQHFWGRYNLTGVSSTDGKKNNKNGELYRINMKDVECNRQTWGYHKPNFGHEQGWSSPTNFGNTQIACSSIKIRH